MGDGKEEILPNYKTVFRPWSSKDSIKVSRWLIMLEEDSRENICILSSKDEDTLKVANAIPILSKNSLMCIKKNIRVTIV